MGVETEENTLARSIRRFLAIPAALTLAAGLLTGCSGDPKLALQVGDRSYSVADVDATVAIMNRLNAGGGGQQAAAPGVVQALRDGYLLEKIYQQQGLPPLDGQIKVQVDQLVAQGVFKADEVNPVVKGIIAGETASQVLAEAGQSDPAKSEQLQAAHEKMQQQIPVKINPLYGRPDGRPFPAGVVPAPELLGPQQG